MIRLTWVEWMQTDGGIRRWKAHILPPGSSMTVCGIDTTGAGAETIGAFSENERPWGRHTCCRACLVLRKRIADHIRLNSWNEQAGQERR